MPVATIHLLSLSDPSTLPSLIKHIKTSNVRPLVVSKPIRWIIRPEHIETSALLTPRWDLLLILEENPQSQDLIMSLTSSETPVWTTQSRLPFQITNHWSAKTGIPSRLTKDFLSKTNPSLLHPQASDIPALTGALDKPLVQSSSQDLSLSHDLRSWIGTSEQSLPVPGAVSMLNLLSFKSGHKESYLKYGKAFAETIGAKRGGNAKLVGNIIHGLGAKDGTEPKGAGLMVNAEGKGEMKWDEFALAHYPSLLHFADMLASKDYQEVNQKHRVPSLADTCILCTSELEIEKMIEEQKAKL